MLAFVIVKMLKAIPFGAWPFFWRRDKKILTGLPELFYLPTSIGDEITSHIHHLFDDTEQAA